MTASTGAKPEKHGTRRAAFRWVVLSGAALLAAPVFAQSQPPAPLPRGLPTDRPLEPYPQNSQAAGPRPGSRPLTNAPEPGLLPAWPGRGNAAGNPAPGAGGPGGGLYEPGGASPGPAALGGYGPNPYGANGYGATPYGQGTYGPGSYGPGGYGPGQRPAVPVPPAAGLPGMPPAGAGVTPPLPPNPEDWFYDRPPAYVRDFSWIYVDTPRPQEIKVHDIVTIVVNEKARFDANSQFNRTRNATLKAELKEFIRLGKDGNLNTAASNQPTIDTNLNGRLQSNGLAIDAEGANYRIAATVVDVLPNGYLVLEARKSIRTNRDLFEYSLTGILRPDDISPRNEAYSEDIANLQVVRKSRGKIYNSTKRPWGLRLYDLLFPF